MRELSHPWARWGRGPVAGNNSVSSSRDRDRGVHRPYCNCRVADHPWPIALKARKLSKQAAPYPTTGSRVYIANCDFPTGLDLAGWTADQHILNLVAIPSASPPNKANVWLLSTIRRCGRNWIAPRGICDVRKLQDLVLPRMDFAHSNLAWLFLTFDGGHRCAGGALRWSWLCCLFYHKGNLSSCLMGYCRCFVAPLHKKLNSLDCSQCVRLLLLLKIS